MSQPHIAPREIAPIGAEQWLLKIMSAVKLDPNAVDVAISDDRLVVILADGREVAAPLVWFPRLLEATLEQRRNWRLIGHGHGIRWPDVDEDISVASLLRAG